MCDVLCDACMRNGVLLSGFVLYCCVFARVGFNVCVFVFDLLWCRLICFVYVCLCVLVLV